MSYIKSPDDLPGIRGLFAYRPETAKPMNQLAEVLLRAPSTLAQWERELIGAYTSHLNECKFCCNVHAAMVEELSPPASRAGGRETGIFSAVKEDIETAPVSRKMKALLRIAAKVQQDARRVLPSDVEEARKQGATDLEIHDAVLITACFCMFNKYVDGLGTVGYPDPESYSERAKVTSVEGYI